MHNKHTYTLADLLQIMAALRDQDNGCPWDLEQDYATIVPYTIAEAYEVADAIAREDKDDLREELGDLLLQVVYYCQFAQEDGNFAFADVVHSASDKMIRRHPHVFGDQAGGLHDIDQINRQWETIKQQEKQRDKATTSVEHVKSDTPALQFTHQLGARAADYGFDWPDTASVTAKIREECGEIADEDADIEEEIGDLMFAMVQLCRKAELDPENTLRKAGLKFQRRFVAMSQHPPLPDTLEGWEARWENVKKLPPL